MRCAPLRRPSHSRSAKEGGYQQGGLPIERNPTRVLFPLNIIERVYLPNFEFLVQVLFSFFSRLCSFCGTLINSGR